jgi:serine/threonine-protein kinase HipA
MNDMLKMVDEGSSKGSSEGSSERSLDLAAGLDVFIDGQRVGTLHNQQPLAFSYAPEWLARANALAISTHLPLSAATQDTPMVGAFFENLLPEGNQRKLISLRYHVSTVFGMLSMVGGDSAGALVLLPPGQLPAPAAYEPMSWAQLGKLLHPDGSSMAALDQTPADDDVGKQTNDRPDPERISLSGAQVKMLISLDSDGNPLYPLGASPTTHIVKPDMFRGDSKLFATAINETLVMRTASLCGLPTAKVSYQATLRACLVERYDRVAQADGSLLRLWQADFCQLAGIESGRKYEADGGPSFKQCFDLLAKHSARPAQDQRHLLRWLFFNLYTGNNDSHAKNLAICAAPEGLRLAPFYDLLCTRVYAGLGRQFAFTIAGEALPGNLNRGHWLRFAQTLGVAPKYLFKIAAEMADQVLLALPQAMQQILPGVAPAETVLLGRIEAKIISTIRKMQQRMLSDDA